jgi:hypothetical protein
MKNIASILLIILTLSLFILGCTSGTGIYGQEITEEKTTLIGDILGKAEQFAGKTVKVEGKIVEECPTGCWFMLKDDTGVIFVNLGFSSFAIPQAIGHRAIAQGVVKKEGMRIEVVGKGVELK